MARFEFRLGKLLGVKEQIENQKEIEYASALRQVAEEKQRLAQFEDSKQKNIQGLRESIQKKIEPIEVRRYNNNLERLNHMIEVQKERIKAAEYMAEEKRLELVEAMKERKALEIVKDNAYEEFKKNEDIKERKITDELTSYKYSLNLR